MRFLTRVLLWSLCAALVVGSASAQLLTGSLNTGPGGALSNPVTPAQGGTGGDFSSSTGILYDAAGTFSAISCTSGLLQGGAPPTCTTTPALGTPASGVATNLTGTAAGLTAGNASLLNGTTWAAPGPIGGTTSSTGAFTDLQFRTSRLMLQPAAVCDNVTDDTAVIQADINTVRASGGTVLLPKGNCVVTSLDLTNSVNVHLRGVSREATQIIVKSTDANGLDLTGALRTQLSELWITGDATLIPKTLILMARSTTNPGFGAQMDFRRILVDGSAGVAGIYNYGAESYLMTDVNIAVITDAARGYYHTATNTASIASAFTAIVAGSQSSGNGTWIAGSIKNYTGGTPTQAESMLIDGGGGLRFYGTYFAGGVTRAIKLVGPINQIAFDGIIQEPTSAGTPTYGIDVTASSVVGLSVTNSGLTAGTSGIHGAAGTTIRGLATDRTWNSGNASLVSADTLTGSSVGLSGRVSGGVGHTATTVTSALGNAFIGSNAASDVSLPSSAVGNIVLPQSGVTVFSGTISATGDLFTTGSSANGVFTVSGNTAVNIAAESGALSNIPVVFSAKGSSPLNLQANTGRQAGGTGGVNFYGGGAGNAIVASVSNTGDITSGAKIRTNGTAPSVGGSCGTSPSVAGTSVAGKVTTGSVAPTSCTVTFATAWPTAPACSANNETTANLTRATSTTTTVVLAGTMAAGDILSYICVGGS